MSCRRSDSTRLVGCRIGDVGMRGCSRGCCDYPDSEISQNTRPHLLTQYYPPTHTTAETGISGCKAPGRTNLYYNRCQSSYRPKFICANSKPGCRRLVKPFFDPTLHEYAIDEYQGLSIRPLPSRNPEFKAAVTRWESMGYWAQQEITALRNRDADAERGVEGVEALTWEEKAYLKERLPSLWWTEMVEGFPRPGKEEKEHMKRCPSCGEAVVRVGSKFRVPKRDDEKAWREIQKMIEQKVDMEAKFSSCWTVEEHESMVEKALRLRGEGGGIMA